MRLAICGGALAIMICGAAHAEISGGIIRIGVLTDLSGPFSAWAGQGSVVAAQMAADDFVKERGELPYKIEIISADFQLKADIATAITRRWISEGVDAIVDVPQSGAALAVNGLIKGSSAALLITGAQHDDLTTSECSPNTAHWTFDSSSLTKTTVAALAADGANSWFFVTVNLAGGQSMEGVARAAIDSTGGKTVGGVRTPPNAPDFASFLLQATSSKAKTIGIIQGGGDLVNVLKQTSEFGAGAGGQRLAVMFAQLTDIKAIGLSLAQGLIFTEAFYWDIDEGKRSFAKRFADHNGNNYPTAVQAGAYSAVLHYLRAVEATRSDNGPIVVARMKELPVTDPVFGPGTLRPDGWMVHDMYLVEVKTPRESNAPWDLYKVLQKVPGDHAFRSISTSCDLVSRVP